MFVKFVAAENVLIGYSSLLESKFWLLQSNFLTIVVVSVWDMRVFQFKSCYISDSK